MIKEFWERYTGLIILFLIDFPLILMKFLHILNLSWWIIVAPIWIPLCIVLLIMVLIFIVVWMMQE